MDNREKEVSVEKQPTIQLDNLTIGQPELQEALQRNIAVTEKPLSGSVFIDNWFLFY